MSLDRLGLADVGGRVLFMQGDACNLKPIYTDYDLVFAGNLIDRLYDPALFLDGIASRILPGGLLVITSPYTWLEEYTPKAKWIGGRREHGEPLSTFAGLSRCLEPALHARPPAGHSVRDPGNGPQAPAHDRGNDGLAAVRRPICYALVTPAGIAPAARRAVSRAS